MDRPVNHGRHPPAAQRRLTLSLLDPPSALASSFPASIKPSAASPQLPSGLATPAFALLPLQP